MQNEFWGGCGRFCKIFPRNDPRLLQSACFEVCEESVWGPFGDCLGTFVLAELLQGATEETKDADLNTIER